MTIAVVWQEGGLLFCAADTRLVAGVDNKTTTEMAAKIYSISMATRAMTSDFELRRAHFWTKYGFIYAGAALPATMTAANASTLLQNLARPGDLANPPMFEEVAELVCRLSKRFMLDRRRFGNEGDGVFSAAFLGWCPFSKMFKVAHIDGRNDAGGFRVELSYPEPPTNNSIPWLVLGSAASTFRSELAAYQGADGHIDRGAICRVIGRMVTDERDKTVGGAISIGAAHEHGFELFSLRESTSLGSSENRLFNGLDLDVDVGTVGQYFVEVDVYRNDG
jgi:hypothetical protein